MNKLMLPFIILGLQLAHAEDFDVKLLANNKESYTRQITGGDRKAVNYWVKNLSLNAADVKSKSVAALGQTMNSYLERESQCDLGLPTLLSQNAIDQGLLRSHEDMPAFLAYLRENNLIDDIFYRILKDGNDVNTEIVDSAKYDYPGRPFNLYTDKNKDVDVAKMYSMVKSWPDDVQYCTLGRYFRLTNEIKWSNSKDRDDQMHKLNYIALKESVITLQTYHKLEILRRREVLDWDVNINGYLDVVRNAKDKLAKTIETASTNSFNEKYVSRKEQITHRGRLYKVFSSTQIMMLAQVIEKTSKRMEARRVGINFQFTDDPAGETETYVLSPMEQYRVSIKMLRKDLGEVMRSDNFRGTGVAYEDLVSAAFETGLIKSDELDHIVKFEDMWNPKVPRWKKYANFAFNLAGTASFFLPQPWGMLGAIALIITQSKIMKDDKADPEDNWNAIL